MPLLMTERSDFDSSGLGGLTHRRSPMLNFGLIVTTQGFKQEADPAASERNQSPNERPNRP